MANYPFPIAIDGYFFRVPFSGSRKAAINSVLAAARHAGYRVKIEMDDKQLFVRTVKTSDMAEQRGAILAYCCSLVARHPTREQLFAIGKLQFPVKLPPNARSVYYYIDGTVTIDIERKNMKHFDREKWIQVNAYDSFNDNLIPVEPDHQQFT